MKLWNVIYYDVAIECGREWVSSKREQVMSYTNLILYHFIYTSLKAFDEA